MSKKMLIVCTVALTLLGSFASAATFTVTNLNDSGAGSLRQAMVDANALAGADVIEFQPGVAGTITLNSRLEIKDDLTINGPGADVVSVSGNNNAYDVFFIVVLGSNVSISDLTMTDGQSGFVAGTDNTHFGLITLTDCVISNHLYSGIINRQNMILNNCIITGNNNASDFVPYGGGVWNSWDLTANNCTFSNNHADDRGGGIFTYGFFRATGCTFDNNSSADGGACYNDNIAQFTNCTFSGNSATSNGGAIYVSLTGLGSLTHCTIFDNSAGSAAGGIYHLGRIGIRNNLIAGNTPENFSSGPDAEWDYTEGNLDSDGSMGLSGTGDISGTPGSPLDPMLGPLQDNGGPTKTHALLAGSIAIDAAIPSAVVTDQRGVTRPQDGNGDGNSLPDIGAYEHQPANLSLSKSAAPVPYKGNKAPALAYTITLNNSGPGTASDVVVTDTIPTGAVFLSASATKNGVPLPSSALTTPPVGGAGSVFAHLGNVLNGTSAVITINVTVQLKKGTLTNTATVTSTTFDPVPANNTVTLNTVIK